MKAVQKFTVEYLEQCKKMKPEQIVKFLDDFRKIHGQSVAQQIKVKTRLISIKVEEDLLATFKAQCQLLGVPYQTQIKKLMRKWKGNLDY